MIRLIRRFSSSQILRISAALTILGLALMVWSMLVPTPMPVILAMSLGQLFGTTAFALYGVAILRELLRARRAGRADAAADPAAADEVAP